MTEDDQQGEDLDKKSPDLGEVELDLEIDEVEEATLRVIEQEPALREISYETEEEAQKEVLRLDQKSELKSDSTQKVEARKNRDFLNTMMADTAADYMDPEDQDAQWIREAAASQVRAVPFGWFILLILIFGGVLFWGAIQMWSSEETPKVSKEPSKETTGFEGAQIGDFINPKDEENQKKEAELGYQRMERTIKTYLGAATLDEKVKHVRHRERVEPLMRDYYTRNAVLVREYETISEYHIVSLDNHPFIAVRADLTDGDSLPLLLEEKDDEFKIDWESEVSYQPIALKQFREERPQGATDFRFYVMPDRFYAYEFRDESKWRCYKLTARNSEEYFFGYLERGSLLEQEMNKVTAWDPLKKPNIVPLLLRVSFPPAGRGLRTLRIEEIVSKRWAYSINPNQD